MALPTPPGPLNPIPNNPFYYPETNNLSTPSGSLIVGAGIFIDNITGTISAGGTGGGITTILPGSGIFVSANVGGIVTVTNTGVISLNAGPGISVSGSNGNFTITNTLPATSATGTVTSVNTGTGLTGGPITTSGTIALSNTTVAPGLYTNATIRVDAQGRVTYATTGSAGGTLLATSPIQITAGIPQTISVLSASTASEGVVRLNDTTSSTSNTQAATPSAVKATFDLATSASSTASIALATANSATLTANAALASGTAAIPCSAFGAKGQLLAGTGISSYLALNPGANGQVLMACAARASGLAWATPVVSGGTVTVVATGAGLTGGPITTAGTLALTTTGVVPGDYTFANFTVDGYGRLSAASSSTAPVTSVTGTAPIAVTAGTTPTVSITAASTTALGAVQLYDDTNSPSTTLALTAAQGKSLQDQITALAVTGTVDLAGTIDASTGFMVSVTSAGVLAGYTVGAILPAASAATVNSYAIVTTPGTITPPGGSTTAATRGDWFLVSEITPGVYSWEFLNVGFDAPAATTSVAGIVCLSTDALAQAGLDTTTALTPAAAASAYIPKTCITAKGGLITGTAADTPVALTVGTDGQVLFACSTAPEGICWDAIPVVPATPLTLGTLKGCTECGSVSLGTNALLNPGVNLNNVAVGNNAMLANSGGFANVGIGVNALCCNSSGSQNIAIGDDAMLFNTTGTGNLAIGANSLYANLTGVNNISLGTASSFGNNGSGNVAVGTQALFQATNSGRSVALGEGALGAAVTTQYSTAVGWNALAGATGSCNVAIGGAAGTFITTGDYNVVIGPNVQVPFGNQSCQLVIGWENNRWITGDNGLNIKPGAGIRDCANSLGTSGQVLTSTGGAVQWAVPSKGYAYAFANPGIVNQGTTVGLNVIESSQITVAFNNFFLTAGRTYLLNANFLAGSTSNTGILRWKNNIGQVGPEIYFFDEIKPNTVSSSWIYKPVVGTEGIQIIAALRNIDISNSNSSSIVITEL